MLTPLLIVSGLTILVSALCSLLEAMILSTTTAEIEGLKNAHPKRGQMLERFKQEIEETSSAVLGLNTIANTAGAVVAGGLAVEALGQDNMIFFSTGMVLSILLFSEVIPQKCQGHLSPLPPALPYLPAGLHPVADVAHFPASQVFRETLHPGIRATRVRR